MKKRKIVGLGMALLTSGALLSGCSGSDEYQTVYGPPESFDPSASEEEDVYGPPWVTPDESEENEPEADESGENESDADESENSLVDPGKEMALLYGPPPVREETVSYDGESAGLGKSLA